MIANVISKTSLAALWLRYCRVCHAIWPDGLSSDALADWVPPDICYCYDTSPHLTSPSYHRPISHPLVILSFPPHGHRPLSSPLDYNEPVTRGDQARPGQGGIKLINISALTALILRVIHPEDSPVLWGPTVKYLPGLDWKIFLGRNNLYLSAVIHILAGMNHSPSYPASQPVFSCCKASLCSRECSENIKHSTLLKY